MTVASSFGWHRRLSGLAPVDVVVRRRWFGGGHTTLKSAERAPDQTKSAAKKMPTSRLSFSQLVYTSPPGAEILGLGTSFPGHG